MKKKFGQLTLFLFFLSLFMKAFSQDEATPVLKLIQPFKTENTVNFSRQFLIGSICKGCALQVNSSPVKLYPTGAFVFEMNLLPGDTLFTLSVAKGRKSISKKIKYTYVLPRQQESLETLDISYIQTFPEGDLVIRPGDKIRFKVKALSHCFVKAWKNIALYEMPASLNNGIAGIYQGEYIIKEADTILPVHIPVSVTDSSGKTVTRETNSKFLLLSSMPSDVLCTKGRLAHLEYGLGDDRLGGAKIGYIDSSILLKLTGKVGSHYKIQLSPNRTAYIPDDLVDFMPKGTFAPSSLTGKWSVYGDEKYDYVKLGLFARLPYQSFQLLDPSRIIVDVFGATNNTNWITQYNNVKEIADVDYEQVEDGIFRITIQLKHRQHWGHQVYYSGNNLVIKIKRQPENLKLKNLVIAIDAGHGGSNNGAVGATGVYEKELTLALSLQLKQILEKEGAKVIMTREKEQFVDNKERILFYRDSMPDLLVSIHLNSSEDPLHVSGTSTYYRYIGFRGLSLAIRDRLMELGLQDYGNTGSFNFMLNSPTEYPNALVEALFLSNPDEEAKILDVNFREKIAQKITAGIKDFLQDCEDTL